MALRADRRLLGDDVNHDDRSFPDPAVDGARMRLAVPADNEQLLSLFSDVPMRGSLVLSTERSPDFFALYDQQDATTECWVYDDNGSINAMGTFIYRAGWHNGQPATVTYLGDLRARPNARGALARLYGETLATSAKPHDTAGFYTGILASNEQALAALTRRSKKRSGQPIYHPLRDYDAVQVQFFRKPPAVSGVAVVTADQLAISDVTAFLNDAHRDRPFGYRFDRELPHRLANWPGFSAENTYVAHDGSGAIVGVCTAWDAAPVKQYRVRAYRGSMRAFRWAYNAAAWPLGQPSLPAPGACFNYLYLANLAVPSNDPDVLRALLRRVMSDNSRAGYHFIMVYMERGARLNEALGGLMVQRLPFRLFAVTASDAPEPNFSDATTGFEIALA